MKNVKLGIVSLILALLLPACLHEEETAPGSSGRRIEIGASLMPASKVILAENGLKLKQTWQEGDAVSVIYRREGRMVNEKFVLAAGAGTASARFVHDASLLPDNTSFTIAYPCREESDEGVWAVLLGAQTGKVEDLGGIFPLMADAASLADAPTLVPAVCILRFAEGLKFFSGDDASAVPVSMTVTGSTLHATAVFSGERTLAGNKGPVSVSGGLTLTGGRLDKPVYVALHLTDAGLTDTQLDIRLRRAGSPDSYNWTLSRSGTMERGKMYTIRPDASGINNAIPPKRLADVIPDPLGMLYVSPDGNDSNTGGFSDPFKTLQKAFDEAAAGTQINLRGGTYNESAFLYKSGTADHPIVITAYAPEGGVPENVRIDGTGTVNRSGYDGALVALLGPGTGPSDCRGADWVVVRNITIENAPMIGLALVCGSSHVTVSECSFRNCPGPAIGVGYLGRESEDIRICSNDIENCATESREAISLRKVNGFEVFGNRLKDVPKEGIDAKNGSRNGIIHGNELENAGAVGIYVDAGYDIEPAGILSTGERVPASENILIHSNRIVYGTRGGTAIAVASERGNAAHDIFIFNNVIFNASGRPATSGQAAGIKVAKNSAAGIHTGLLKDIYIYNNTVYNMMQQGIYVNYPTIDNIVVRNNIAAANQAGDIQVHPDVDAGRVVIQNNLFYNTVASPTVATTHPGTPYWVETSLEKIFSRHWDPDWKRIDLQLPAAGAAIDRGTFQTAPDVDFKGNLRPRGTAVDLGAYEYQP